MTPIKKVLLLSLLLLLTADCANHPELARKIYHDASNPCTRDQPWENQEECELWQKKYPKEYKRYLIRTELYAKSKGL